VRIGLTGASGYVGSWVARELVSRGHVVCGTVRDPSRDDTVGHLRALDADLPGTLHLFAADLLEPNAFDAAFADCEAVVHTASPFLLRTKDPQASLIDPALRGTENVLASVNRTASVRRVVLTSSVVAIFGDTSECARRGGVLDGTHWNETARLDYQPYALSKTLAERAAWRLAEAQDRWSLVTIHPGFVMGPSLSDRADGESAKFLLDYAGGKLPAIWDTVTPWVDVRDVAIAHAEAVERDEAAGRYILSQGEHAFLDVSRMIHEARPNRFRPPTRRVPKWFAYLAGPWMGFSWEYIRENVGWPLAMDRSRSESELGIRYRPLAETLGDHLDQLVADGLLKG
jgi:nucleoside-diphosphate-sugar epimerase